LDRNVYLILIVAGVIVLLAQRRRVMGWVLSNPWLLVFIGYCAVSIAWSDYPDVAFKRWIKSLSQCLMVLIVLTDRESLAAIKQILTRASFILIPTSVLMIKYYPDMGRYYDPWSGTMFVSGVAPDKNMLGMTCMIFGLAAWWRVLGTWADRKSSGLKLRLMAHFTIVAMVLWLFQRADSKTSECCFLMSASLMALSMFRSGRKRVVVHAMVIICVFGSLAVVFLSVGGSVLVALGRDATLTGRTEIWKSILPFAGNPLLGTGFESFWLGERLRKIWALGGNLYGINEAHDSYLHIFLTLGWIGVILLAALLVTGYRTVLVQLRLDPDKGRLGLGYFVAAIVYGYTEGASFGMTSSVWFGFLLATTAAPNRLRKSSLAFPQPAKDQIPSAVRGVLCADRGVTTSEQGVVEYSTEDPPRLMGHWRRI
jgi:O-antigen ligase